MSMECDVRSQLMSVLRRDCMKRVCESDCEMRMKNERTLGI